MLRAGVSGFQLGPTGGQSRKLAMSPTEFQPGTSANCGLVSLDFKGLVLGLARSLCADN